MSQNLTHKNHSLAWWSSSPPSEGLGEAAHPYGTSRPQRLDQFFYYSAFGESLVSQNTNTGSFATPYKFNAKEQDHETGNYYYGARYYNPQTSIWFGVDPLGIKRSWLTPYNFVQNRPVMLIDPSGKLDENPNLNSCIKYLNPPTGILLPEVTVISTRNIFHKVVGAIRSFFRNHNFVFRIKSNASLGLNAGLNLGMVKANLDLSTIHSDELEFDFVNGNWINHSHPGLKVTQGVKISAKSPIKSGKEKLEVGLDIGQSQRIIDENGIKEGGMYSTNYETHVTPFLNTPFYSFDGEDGSRASGGVRTDISDDFKGIDFIIGASLLLGFQGGIKIGLEKKND